MTRIAVLDDWQDVARTWGPWERLGEDVQLDVYTASIRDEEELLRTLEPYDIVVAMRERTPFGRARIERLPNLRLLVTTGPFNAAIDLQAASDHGITVSATGFSLASTTELTWALILAVARNVCQEDAAVRVGGWQHTIGIELEGRTLGLLGLGNTGKRMVPIARAFGMHVIAWSQNLDPAAATALGVEAVDRMALFSRADILSVHYVLSDRSRGLVGREELALMRPDAYLVNTSRGPLVDEAALVDALRGGRLAGAALDVFDVEPLPSGHPLRSLPNVVLSPHLGYVARGHYEGWYRDIVEDIEGFLAGTPVRVIAGPSGD